MGAETFPVSVRIALPAVRASEYLGLRDAGRPPSHRFRSCKGLAGELLAGETPLCPVTVTESGDGVVLDEASAARLAARLADKEKFPGSVQVRLELMVGSMILGFDALERLRPGAVLACREAESDAVRLVEEDTGALLAEGECVVCGRDLDADGRFAVRITSVGTAPSMPAPRIAGGIPARVVLGVSELSPARVADLGEGSIVETDTEAGEPATLVAASLPVATGRVTVRRGRRAFLVRDVLGGGNASVEPEGSGAPDPIACMEKPEAVLRDLRALPPASLVPFLGQVGVPAAACILKLLEADAAAEVLPGLLETYGEAFLAAYVQSEPGGVFPPAARVLLRRIRSLTDASLGSGCGEDAVADAIDRLSAADPRLADRIRGLLPGAGGSPGAP